MDEEKWNEKSFKCKTVVNNVPRIFNDLSGHSYSKHYYIVARYCEDDHQLWFWGAYTSYEKAQKSAAEMSGIILEMEFEE